MYKIISLGKEQIMSPSHIRWTEFRERLKGSEGCNFRQDEFGKLIWNCDYNYLYSKSILMTIPNINIEKTIEYFEEHGGYCDCEILFNVDTDKTLLNTIRRTKVNQLQE